MVHINIYIDWKCKILVECTLKYNTEKNSSTIFVLSFVKLIILTTKSIFMYSPIAE